MTLVTLPVIKAIVNELLECVHKTMNKGDNICRKGRDILCIFQGMFVLVVLNTFILHAFKKHFKL